MNNIFRFQDYDTYSVNIEKENNPRLSWSSQVSPSWFTLIVSVFDFCIITER